MTPESERPCFILGAGFSAAYSMSAPTMYTFLSQAQKVGSFDPEGNHRDLAHVVTKYFDSFKYCNIEELANLLLSEPLDPFADYEHRSKCYQDLLSIITYTLHNIQNDPRDAAIEKVFEQFAEKLVQKNGTIVTFNYDLLAETLLMKTKKWSPRDGYGAEIPTVLQEHTPSNMSRRFESFMADEPISECLILKLHGSVSWGIRRMPAIDGSRSIVQNDWGWFFKEHMPRIHSIADTTSHSGSGLGGVNFFYDPILIPPQVDKSHHYARPLIKLLWYIAREVLARSNVVYLLGYSMPPSDFEVRRLLRDAYAWRARSYDRRRWQFRVVDRDPAVADRLRALFEGSDFVEIQHVGTDICYYLKDIEF